MAYLYQRVGGLKFEKFIAKLDNVQWEVEDRALEIGARAENLLKDHHVEGIAHIEVVKAPKVDTHIQLVDSEVTNSETADSNSALSIEFGRAGFLDENGDTWGAMDGLHILTQAAHLPKAKGNRVPKKRRNRPSRNRRGRFTKTTKGN